MKLVVTNIHDRPVERLGHYFAPGESYEIQLESPRHLHLLNACRFLKVEVQEEQKQEEQVTKSRSRSKK